MDDNNNSVNGKVIIIGVLLLIVGLALFIAGAVTGLDGQWYLMFIAIPFFVSGIIVIALQFGKKFMEKQKTKSIALLKEVKKELADTEPLNPKIKCPFCGADNESNSRFCNQCGKEILDL